MNFWTVFFGVLLVVAAGGVVFCRRPLNSALSLVASLFLVAVHFVLLDAPFVAAIQVLVYAGAIMVLVIFVIMLLGLDAPTGRKRWGVPGILTMVSVALFFWLCTAVVNSGMARPQLGGPTGEVGTASTAAIGSVLFTKFLFPFELASILLLAAIIGAVVIASEPKRPLPKGRGLRAMHVAETPEEGKT